MIGGRKLNPGERTFKIMKIGNNMVKRKTRYRGYTSISAAKKAFRRYANKNNKNSGSIIIRETTRGSEKKLFEYKFNRVKLNEPVSIGDVQYKYKIVSQSCS